MPQMWQRQATHAINPGNRPVEHTESAQLIEIRGYTYHNQKRRQEYAHSCDTSTQQPVKKIAKGLLEGNAIRIDGKLLEGCIDQRLP